MANVFYASRIYSQGFDFGDITNTVSINEAVDQVDATVFNSDGHYVGADSQRNHTLSYEGFIDLSPSGYLVQSAALGHRMFLNTVVIPSTKAVEPGQDCYWAYGLNTAKGLSYSQSATGSLSLEQQGIGRSDEGKVLLPKTLITANTDGDSVDMGNFVGKVALVLQVFSASGSNPEVTVSVDESSDESNWAQIGEFAVQSGRGAPMLMVNKAERYLRASVVLGNDTDDTYVFVSAHLINTQK